MTVTLMTQTFVYVNSGFESSAHMCHPDDGDRPSALMRFDALWLRRTRGADRPLTSSSLNDTGARR